MGKWILLVAVFGVISCGGSKSKPENSPQPQTEQVAEVVDPMKNKGIGPIKEIKLPETIDETLAKRGEEVFKNKCSVCHKLDERYVGPPLKGITKRRTPEWIMNIILNPQEMTQKDPIAKKLLQEYLTQMSVQASQDEARAILEYFRKVDSQK